MGLRAIAPGPLASVQDLGRTGFREFGVPASGAFDLAAMALANALAGNEPLAAVLEMTGFGGIFEAETSLAVAIAGAPMRAHVVRLHGPDLTLQIPQSFTIRPGDQLVLGRAPHGHRTYLATRGGWRTPPVLGSRSAEQPIVAGDLLDAMPAATLCQRPASWIQEDPAAPIRYLDGPDAAFLPHGGLDALAFRVAGLADRVGIRLEGSPIAISEVVGRLSSPVCPGAIQVAGGLPLVLGPACGTMGGYPHVGHVISADRDRLAQLRPGEEIRFRRVDLGEARMRDDARREEVRTRCLVIREAATWAHSEESPLA